MVSSSERSRPPRAALNGIDVANNVGHGHVGSGQLFDVAAVAGHPGDRRVVALGGDFFAASAADGLSGSSLISQPATTGISASRKIDQSAQNAALGLPAQSQQNKIVPREQRRSRSAARRCLRSRECREKRLAALDQPQKIAANFILHRAGNAASVKIGNAFQFPKRARFRVLRMRLHRCRSGHRAPV